MGGHYAAARSRLVAMWLVSLELAMNVLFFILDRVAVANIGVGNGDQ